MLVNEVLRNIPSKNEISKMLANPQVINVSNELGDYRITTDEMIMNLVTYRRGMYNSTVHPVTLLGMFCTKDLIDKMFSNKNVQMAFRQYENDNKSSAKYNTKTGEISINELTVRLGSQLAEVLSLAHEFNHKGLAMANGDRNVVKYVKAVSRLPFTKPFHAWGSHPDSFKQFGMNGQLATLEHIMMYAHEGDARFRQLYRGKAYLWKKVPGFEEFENYRDVGEKAEAIFNTIGKGVEQYMYAVAKQADNLSDDEMSELIYNWAKKRGYAG